ncbi:hypothetical protein H7169_00140 [Candidatus Gracilibacteria bacterium]|nr:hypothetical protein [Candidatus Gracilibacteria bacterium]
MATQENLQKLIFSKQSIHVKEVSKPIITVQIQIIKTAIETILTIVNSKSGSDYDLEHNLGIISSFFREQTFTTVILPVLQNLATEDTNIWKNAKQGDTQMPLIPKSFENMKASTAKIQGSYSQILAPLQQERELALLSVYGVTLQILGELFRALKK